MATTVVNSDTSDGTIESDDASYSNAQDGLGLVTTYGNLYVGQNFNDFVAGEYAINEGFLNFDLFAAGIPSSALVSATDLALYGLSNASATGFDVEARTYDWGPTRAAADWVPGSSLSGLTLLASFGMGSYSAGYNTFTPSGTALKDAVTAALAGDGVVRMIVDSSAQVGNSAPAGDDYVLFQSSNDVSGNRPKLTVTYTVPGGAMIFDGF